jgi:DNA-binding PadR family transcriptional regulator
MSINQAQQDEISKLRILQFLSNPQSAGILAARTGGATKDDVERYVQGVRNEGRLLQEMQQAGLVTRQEAEGRRSKPYSITDEGRQYLEDARQKATLMEPWEREGWADLVPNGKAREMLADAVRGLPEFQGSDEARIREVSRILAARIGLLAPQTGRRDVEGFGR